MDAAFAAAVEGGDARSKELPTKMISQLNEATVVLKGVAENIWDSSGKGRVHKKFEIVGRQQKIAGAFVGGGKSSLAERVLLTL